MIIADRCTKTVKAELWSRLNTHGEKVKLFRQFGHDVAMVWLRAGCQDEAASQTISYAIKKGGRVKGELKNK